MARIRSVRPKSGGAKVHLLNASRRAEIESCLIDDAVFLADSSDSPLQGNAIVTWTRDLHAGCAIKFGEGNMLSFDNSPSFVSDNLKRVMRANGMTD